MALLVKPDECYWENPKKISFIELESFITSAVILLVSKVISLMWSLFFFSCNL